MKKYIILVFALLFLVSFVSATQVCEVYDDFESGADKWTIHSGNWVIVDDNGNKVFRQDEFVGGGGHFKRAQSDFYGEKYSAEVDMRYIEQGDFGMTLDIYSNNQFDSDNSVISLTIFPRYNQLSLYIWGDSVFGNHEYTYHQTFEVNKWYHVGVTFEDGLLSAWLDGQEVISNKPTSLSEGYLLIETDDLKAEFDNVVICQEQTEPPQPDLEERVIALEEKVENLTARVTLLETLINKIKSWFWFMPNIVKKDILCNTLEETGETEITDFGMRCEIKELKKKEVCVCKKV